MRPALMMFALLSALATSLLAAPEGTPAKEAPVKPRLELSPELREFRKTAALWGPDVLDFLAQAGVPAPIPSLGAKP
ncbi:MAG: hypothetical protein WAM82_14345 [Thermoanaerobaculia bacterium]